ncbi:hypothetical protein ACEU6E_04175 [Halorutilales archaeon Cl-col2-1]
MTELKIGDRITYYDGDGEPHEALVTQIHDTVPSKPPMVDCVRQKEGEFSDSSYGQSLIHEKTVEHVSVPKARHPPRAHSYDIGWDAK